MTFEAAGTSTGSWQAVNVNGGAVTIAGLNTQTLDVLLSHNIWALALDAQGGIGFKVSTSPVE